MAAGDTRERRTVTVLFSDLSGFTRLSESMDPEEVSDLVDALFRKFRAVIEAHGGTVDKFIGDAVMAVFGAPLAHADDPLRAVRAAIAMQGEIEAFNGERALSLAMRVGVNTGEILWGGIGGDRATAMGDAVNVAQRLESAARPGSVLVSEATHREVRRHFRFGPALSVTVKGREEPVKAHEVEEELSGETEVRPAAPSALVGRGAELSRLVAMSENGEFVLISGEAGCGKSRLLAEFRREVRTRSRDVRVLTGRALEHVRLPLGPLGDALRTEAGAAGLGVDAGARMIDVVTRDLERAGGTATDIENAAHLIAISAGADVPGSRVRDIEPEQLARETTRAWSLWLRAAAPVTLCLEDLQWCDDAGRVVLAGLPGALKGARVSVVATTRPSSLTTPAGFTTIPLGDLPPEAVRSLAEQALGGPVHDDLHRFVAEQSGGHPYTVEELCRFLRDENLLAGPPFNLTARPSRLPSGLSGLLVSRLDLLAAPIKEALKVASVCGRVFWSEFASRLAGRDLSPDIDAARAQELVYSQPSSVLAGDRSWIFKHALLRDAAYSLLTRKERQRFHSAAAAALEERAAREGPRMKALAATHRRSAGEDSAAAALWVAASEEALDKAPQEALAWAREAVASAATPQSHLCLARVSIQMSLLDEADLSVSAILDAPASPPALRQYALIIGGKIDDRRGRGESAISRVDEVLSAPATPDLRLSARAHRSEFLGHVGRFREAFAEAELGLRDLENDALTPTAAGELRITILNALGTARTRLGEFVPACEALEAAATEARRLGLRRKECSSLERLAQVVALRGDPARALEIYRATQLTYLEAGDRHAVAVSRNNVSSVLRNLGRNDEAVAEVQPAIPVFRETGIPTSLAAALLNLGAAEKGRARYREALDAYEEVLRITRGTGHLPLYASALNNISVVYDRLGDYPKAIALLRESLQLRHDMGDRQAETRTLNNLGLIFRVTGEFEEAEKLHSSALALARTLDSPEQIASSLLNLALVRLSTARWREAAALIDEAQPVFQRTGDEEGITECLIETARALSQLGDPTAGDRARDALKRARASRNPSAEASALAVVATQAMLQGETPRAGEMFEEALRLQRKLGDRQGEADTLVRRGEIRFRSGDSAGAEVDSLAALAAFRDMGALPGIATALGAIGNVLLVTGRLEEARRHLEEALALRRSMGDVLGIARILSSVSFADQALDRMDEAEQGARESLEIRRRIGDPRTVASGLIGLAQILNSRGRYVEAEAAAREAVELARGIGERLATVAALGALGSALGGRNEFAGGREVLEEALGLARDAGLVREIGRVLHLLGQVSMASGDHAAAEGQLREGADLLRTSGHTIGSVHALIQLSRCESELGRAAEARGTLEAALTEARAAGVKGLDTEVDRALAHLDGRP